MDLDIEHLTEYRYAAPVSLAHHVAHLRPLDDAHQQLLDFSLAILPDPGAPRQASDGFGNASHWFSLALPHDSLAVRSRSRVRLRPRFAALDAAASPPWDTLVARLHYVAGAPFEPALEFAQPSPFVPRLDDLQDYGAASFSPGRPLALAAIDLMHRVHVDFAYVSQSTRIETPLQQVLAQRSGVCQDFAHLMAGTLRMLGLPARYVSGYLLTQAAAGAPLMVGADASHAWVQVWCPDTPGVPGGWLDLDPTNDLVPGTGHVRVAVGRDFGDVTPLRGVIRGGGSHTLTVAVRTTPLPGAGPHVARVGAQEAGRE